MSEQPRGDKMGVEETCRDYFENLISPYTARKLFREGKLPGVKVGGQIIFSRSELDKWFNEQSKENVKKQSAGQYGQLRAVAK